MQKRTATIFVFSVVSLLLTANMAQARDPRPAKTKSEKDHWGRIKMEQNYFGHEICLKGTSPTGYVMADYCRNDSPYQWQFHKSDKCLENRYYGGKCLTEIWDEVVLSPRNGLESFTNERHRPHHHLHPHPSPYHHHHHHKSSKSPKWASYYWLLEYTGANERWCLTVDDTDDPPWYLYYRECHEDMHAQKFIMEGKMGF